jgi:SAM-dependent MidA family methyltransferase
MEAKSFEIQSETLFSESLIWKLNRDFYQESGISAFSDGIVPHHMTSSSFVGKTYAELIFAFLKDLAMKGETTEVVYILELGAGHGRLAYHTLKHLQKLLDSTNENLPGYCYVLSDIVEENLAFFMDHPQLKQYLGEGLLDIAYFDAVQSEKLHLRYADKSITTQSLTHPLVAVANYFFDSLPNELYFIEDGIISACSVAINSINDPEGMDTTWLIENMDFTYSKSTTQVPESQEGIQNEILEDYGNQLSGTYMFYPEKAMLCLRHLKNLSRAGLVLLTMDKGFHELHQLKDNKEPEVITHGSFSLWVNYHALSAYCTKQGGKVLFPSSSNFHLEIGCLLFLPDAESYVQVDAAYQQFVNNFGPDDFDSIKQMAYFNVASLDLMQLIALYRLSCYDSTFFIHLLPRLKQVKQSISLIERNRLAQTLDEIWGMYFSISEPFDLPFEIGAIFFDLGYYNKALVYFQHSVDLFGEKADIFYNQALCHYHLRNDEVFYRVLNEGKIAFPDFESFSNLEALDMG